MTRCSTFASLAFALLLVAPSAAQAQGARVAVPGPDPDWVEVNRTDDGTGYVDRRSVRRDNGLVRFLGRINHNANEHQVALTYHLGEIDCARRTFRVVGFDALGADGNVILSHVNTLEDYAPEPINDGSPNADMHREHCG